MYKFQRYIKRFARSFVKVSKDKVQNEKAIVNTSRFSFFNIGFHGDKYLLDIVNHLAANVDVFVETGANVGSTLSYFAQKYPHIPCFSCEPDEDAFRHAQQNVARLTNVTLYGQTSQNFFYTLEKQHQNIFQKTVLFWLDAHGYGFKWPLRDELAFITTKFSKAFILIDDFKVPDMDIFGYDIYEEQICSYDYVKDSLNPIHYYSVYYPNYTEHTSKHHPLRGWGLIIYGKDLNFQTPSFLGHGKK